MRYDNRVVFRQITGNVYDEDTGNYSDGSIIEVARLAHVSEPISYNDSGMLAGTSQEGARKVRIQTPLAEDVTEILIDGKMYSIIIIRKDRRFFVVSRVVR